MTRPPETSPLLMRVLWPAKVGKEDITVKRRRHTPEQIVRKLREVERLLGEGQTAKQVEISEQTCHRWRNQYGGMKADDAKRLRELEREKARLKRIFAPFLANRSRARLTVTRATLALDRRKRAPGREDTGTRRHGQGRGCHRRTPRRSPNPDPPKKSA